MFARFKNFLRSFETLSKDKDGQDFSHDNPKVALIALVFHIIDADGEEHQNEIAVIENIITRDYGLDACQAEALILAGRQAHLESVDIFSFTSTLKKHFNHQQRIDFIGVLWEIAYADGHLYPLEDNLIWRIAELLGVNSRDRLQLKKEIASQEIK